MSWIKENYHIAALGGGILVLAGLGYTSYAAAQETKENLVSSSAGNGKVTTVEGGEALGLLDKSLNEEVAFEAQPNASGRPLNLFTSVDLFTQDGQDSLIDPLTMKEEIHPGIPNKWWVDNGLDPSWSDSPMRDADGDGFTNGEEFADKTDPSDAKSHGDLIKKLKVAEIKTTQWLLEFNTVVGDGFQFNLKYLEPGQKVEQNRMGASDAIKPGELFFNSDPGKERFKLLRIEPREMKTSTGVTDVDFAIIEDQLANKKGKIYELQFGMRQADLLKTTQYDHTVVFYLDAIGESGNKFEVIENGTFSLPAGGEEKNFTLVEVKLDPADKKTPIAVVVEWEVDGKKTPYEIPVNP